MRRLSDRDFLRLDRLEVASFSFFHKLLNQLVTMHPARALLCKVLISPVWFTYSFRQPLVLVNKVDPRIRKLRINSTENNLSVRSQVPFIFDSLARVIILNERRVDKRGRTYSVLRNELHKGSKLGFSCAIFEGPSATKVLDDFYTTSGRRNWRNETRFDKVAEGIRLVASAGLNSSGDIIAVGAMWVSGSYAYVFYYNAVEKLNIRWLVTERLVEFGYSAGVKVFHTDNLMDVSTGSYIFQKSLGYSTVRLRFTSYSKRYKILRLNKLAT